MNYGYQRILETSFSDADEKVRAALQVQGFGVLTEIDVSSTLKVKLDVDVKPYKILGACNPKIAHQAMSAEPGIGLLLPCNIVIRDNEDGTVSVSAIDAQKMLAITGRKDLDDLSKQVNGLLKAAIDAV